MENQEQSDKVQLGYTVHHIEIFGKTLTEEYTFKSNLTMLNPNLKSVFPENDVRNPAKMGPSKIQ